MDTHELVPMTRRRYLSLARAADDAARSATATTSTRTTASLPGPRTVPAVVTPSSSATRPTRPGLPTRRSPVPVVPLPRSRRRASIRLAVPAGS